jgi:hypothetical protein
VSNILHICGRGEKRRGVGVQVLAGRVGLWAAMGIWITVVQRGLGAGLVEQDIPRSA